MTATRLEPTVVTVSYEVVDGWHYFSSSEIPGLCAAGPDLRAVYRAVGIQLGELLAEDQGSTIPFEPAEPVESFEKRLYGHLEPNRPSSIGGAVASWSLTNKKTKMMESH